MAVGLTRRQKEIVTFITTYSEAQGISPTLNEIRLHLSLRSLATVHKHLENLRCKGYINRARNQSRSTALTERTHGKCPYCKRRMPRVL
jgi:repressor LexA